MMIEKSSNHQSWKCLTLVAAMNFWAAPAIAMLEEVIVTAQKRAESVQDVPISIQAFSGDQLEKNARIQSIGRDQTCTESEHFRAELGESADCNTRCWHQ